MKPLLKAKSPPTDQDPEFYPVLSILDFCLGCWVVGETFRGYWLGPFLFLKVNRLDCNTHLHLNQFGSVLGLMICRGFALIVRKSYWLQISREGTGFYVYDRRWGYHWPGW